MLTDEEIDLCIKAGKIAGEARDFGLSLIKPGVRLEEVQLKVEEFIRDNGGECAFPAQISLDNVAAHDCASPGDPRVFTEKNIAKLDVGVHVDGYMADTAGTVDLQNGPESPLLLASKEGLESAIKAIYPNITTGEIGEHIEKAITKRGFKPVYNLTGHGLARFQIHTSPQIPNYGDRSKTKIKPGSLFAIEPFATTGRGYIRDVGSPQVFQLKRKPKAKDNLPLALEKGLISLKGLPFARRDLARFVGIDKVEEALGLLNDRKLLIKYPPLAEESSAMISQAEHTLILLDDMLIVTTDPKRPPIKF